MTISRRDAKQMVGKGWSKLIDQLYDAKPRSVYVMQVKEKYGSLHFYIGGAPIEYHEIIDTIEDESMTICEECGEKGKLRGDLGWILTLCDKHYREMISRNVMT